MLLRLVASFPAPLALGGLGSELGLDGAGLVAALAVAAGPVSTLEVDADD